MTWADAPESALTWGNSPHWFPLVVEVFASHVCCMRAARGRDCLA